MKKIIISVLSATLLLAGCSSHDGQQSKKQSNNSVDTSKVKIKNYNQATSKLKIDNTK